MVEYIYYWILARDNETQRNIILGPYRSEDDANRIGFEKIDGSFEVIPLKTSNVGNATRILKYRRFDQTSKLAEAIKRASHKSNKKY